MKNFKQYIPEKYKDNIFKKIEEGIYFAADEYSTCLSFEQEPEVGEGDSPSNISQYPTEAILEHFSVYVSDFFEDLNASSDKTCYLEFCSPNIEDIRKLRSLIGKRVYDYEEGGIVKTAGL